MNALVRDTVKFIFLDTIAWAFAVVGAAITQLLRLARRQGRPA